jgi:hypothetical protein
VAGGDVHGGVRRHRRRAARDARCFARVSCARDSGASTRGTASEDARLVVTKTPGRLETSDSRNSTCTFPALRVSFTSR